MIYIAASRISMAGLKSQIKLRKEYNTLCWQTIYILIYVYWFPTNLSCT